jgi:hypothetical protein
VKPKVPRKKGQKIKTNRIDGISSYRHQIDISVHCKKHLILLECKKWKAKINARDFLAFLARIFDIEQRFQEQFEVQGSIVTPRGCRRGACKLAEHYKKIDLITATSIKDARVQFSARYSRFLKRQQTGIQSQPQPVPLSQSSEVAPVHG